MSDAVHGGTSPQSPHRRVLLSSTDEIDAYYANPLLKTNRGEQLREQLSRRLNRELSQAGRPAEADDAHPRYGYRLALGVVVGSVILVAVVMLTAARSFAVHERFLETQVLQFYSTETRVLEEMRREAVEVLRRKDEEIDRYLQSLRQMELRLAGLEHEFNRAADGRRVEYAGITAAKVEAEDRRLGALGLTESEISARLAKFRSDVERDHAGKLDEYVGKLTEEHQRQLRALLRQRETAQNQLAEVTVERETLLLTYQERPASEQNTAGISVFGRIQDKAVLEGLFWSQLRKRLDALNKAISADNTDEAYREIGSLEDFLNTDSVRRQETLVVDIRFAERLASSFRALLAGSAPPDTAPDTGLNPPLPPAGESPAPAQPDAQLARAEALDEVADFIDTLMKRSPTGIAENRKIIESVKSKDPRLAFVLQSVLRAVEQAAAIPAAPAISFVEKAPDPPEGLLVVVGTVAFAGDGAVVIERLTSAPMSVGSRLFLRRPAEGRSEVSVAETTVTLVREGFLEASIDRTSPAPMSPRVLDIAYRRAAP